ncbi:MAG: hypothetical protein HC887_02410 [Desulfobacteraceae bacterium]|nr:hypothetical protein [Desulfobacteraceae bacterium]
MLATVRISENLVHEAVIYGKVDNRSLEDQIGHWIRIGKCAEENPDLTYDLIREILLGIEELEQGKCSEYKFG